ncbi:MAG: hypothetical protein ACRBHB_05785, partial [Arenicella sp.]
PLDEPYPVHADGNGLQNVQSAKSASSMMDYMRMQQKHSKKTDNKIHQKLSGDVVRTGLNS